MEVIFICAGAALLIYIFFDDIKKALKKKPNSYKNSATFSKPASRTPPPIRHQPSATPAYQDLRPIDFKPAKVIEKNRYDTVQQVIEAPEIATIKSVAMPSSPVKKEYSNSQIPPATVKICEKCKEMKHENDYFNSEKQGDGLTKWCRECLARLTEKRKLGRYKKCPKCRKNRLISSYFESLKTKDGLSKWCKMCHKKLN